MTTMPAIPTKLYEAFEKIRLGRVDEGVRLFDRIEGFETAKAIPLAELSYFRHDWKRGIQFSLDFLASKTDWETVRYHVDGYQREHLELILIATCQIGCWKESRTALEELKRNAPPNQCFRSNYEKYQIALSLIADPENTMRRLTESKPKPKTKGTIDQDYLEQRIKRVMPERKLYWRSRKNSVSVDGLASYAFSKALTEDHLVFYERYIDRLEDAKSHTEAAKSYISLERMKEAKEAIRKYMRCWEFKEPFQVAPIVLFTDHELWPILSDRHFTESLLTIPHHRES